MFRQLMFGLSSHCLDHATVSADVVEGTVKRTFTFQALHSLAGIVLCAAIFSGIEQNQAAGQLAHRYSFTSDASDSVGSADGTVVDAGTTANFSFTGGMLDFSANTGEASNAIVEDAYLDLPNGIVSSAASNGMDGAVAFEWWSTISTTQTWQRLGDFGNSDGGEDMSPGAGGAEYLMVTPNSGRISDSLEMTNHASTGPEPTVASSTEPPLDTPIHVMAVYNHNDPRGFTPEGANGTMSFYYNGEIVGYGGVHPDIDIRTLDDVNNWLGRSQWPDPLFAGSYDEFRIYDTAPSADYVASSFNAGPDSLPAFDPWVEEFDFTFEVNRDTGTFTLRNDGPALDVVGINISSESGALNPDNWLSVTDNYDFNDGGEFDTDDTWEISDETANLLYELEVLGDGGQLGTGGTLTSLQLGDTGAWTPSFYEDIVVSVERLLDDGMTIETIGVRVDYVGGLGETPSRSDLNLDGTVNGDDWNIFVGGHLTDLSGMTDAESWTAGDLDGDQANDFNDFLLFQEDFDAAQGAGALAQLIANVPEPSSIALLGLAGMTCLGVRRRRN